jgi:hypothetical protein
MSSSPSGGDGKLGAKGRAGPKSFRSIGVSPGPIKIFSKALEYSICLQTDTTSL